MALNVPTEIEKHIDEIITHYACSVSRIPLNFAYYNFCKSHGAIRMTPAQAAGVESSQWTVAELVERCGES